MAWVSVHDNVIGGKLRELASEIGSTREEALGILVSLWLWGLNNANKDGRLRVSERDDILDAFSRKLASKLEPVNIVGALIKTQWIDELDPGEFYIHDWSQWQEQWYKAMERREKDAKRKADSRKKGQIAYEQPQDADKPEPITEKIENPTAESSPEAKEKAEAPRYAPAFENWWKEYPRHIGKGEAYKKYQARRKDGFSDEELLEAAKSYALVCKKQKTDSQYIKHPKTFLSDNFPFLDYLPQKPKTEPVSSDTADNPFSEYEEEWRNGP